MYRRFLLLALAAAPTAALAQFGVSSIDDPIRPDRAPLAIADEVPAIFFLGMGGPTATFVNPARAAHAEHRFVYGTIRPQNAPAEPVSLAGLFGTRNRRWLVTAENRVFTRENSDTQTQTQTSRDPVEDRTTESESSRSIDQSNTSASTRARVLLVSHTDFGGVAFGLFGGYRTASDRDETSDHSDFDALTITPDGTFTQSDRRRRVQRQHTDRDDIGVGAEVALAGRRWDLAAAVSYQRRAAEASVLSDDDDRRTTASTAPDLEEAVRSRDLRLTEQALDGTPSAVDFDVVAALHVGDGRGDYLYGSVTGTYGDGAADYAFVFSEERSRVREINGEVLEESFEATAAEDAGEVALGTQTTRASLGYVYARTPGRKRRGWTGRSGSEHGMTILAAVNPQGGFARTESAVVENNLLVTRRETEQTTLAVEFPLYVRFNVTERLEAFGGGTYTYAYTRTETAEEPLLPADAVPEGTTIRLIENRTTGLVTTDARLYAGAVFTFRSGFTAQASLRGNLAEVSGWTVSMGYHF